MYDHISKFIIGRFFTVLAQCGLSIRVIDIKADIWALGLLTNLISNTAGFQSEKKSPTFYFYHKPCSICKFGRDNKFTHSAKYLWILKTNIWGNSELYYEIFVRFLSPTFPTSAKYADFQQKISMRGASEYFLKLFVLISPVSFAKHFLKKPHLLNHNIPIDV